MARKFLKRIVAQYVHETGVAYMHSVRSPEEVVERFKFLVTRDREEFITVHLDRANHPICWDQVSVGTLTEALVHPREVFKTALLSNATAMILLHNHPSGNLTPSAEDRMLTKKLQEAGALLDIKILDHLIICGDSGFFSFNEHGLL